jgi:hypothetical protein
VTDQVIQARSFPVERLRYRVSPIVVVLGLDSVATKMAVQTSRHDYLYVMDLPRLVRGIIRATRNQLRAASDGPDKPGHDGGGPGHDGGGPGHDGGGPGHDGGGQGYDGGRPGHNGKGGGFSPVTEPDLARMGLHPWVAFRRPRQVLGSSPVIGRLA